MLLGAIASGCGDSKESGDDAVTASPDAATSRDHGTERTGVGGETDTSTVGLSRSSDATSGEGTSREPTLRPSDAGSGETDAAPNIEVSDAGAVTELPPPEGGGSLSDLIVSGALSPAFDPDVHEYEVQLPVFATHLALSAAHLPSATVSIGGKLLDADGRWVSPELDLGVTEFTVELLFRGEVLGSYQLRVVRKKPSVSYLGNDDQLSSAYGYATEVSGDGSTLVIGPSQDNAGAPGVWVFTRGKEGWEAETFLRHPNPPEQDTRGWTLSLSRDGNTLVAGAFGANATYVFERREGQWEFDAQLSNDDASAFGRAVEISADGDTIVVGDDRFFNGEGGVYSFRRSGERWQSQPDVVALDAGDPDQGCALFALSLALDETGQTLAVVQSSLSWGCHGQVTLYENDAERWRSVVTFGGDEEYVASAASDVDLNADGTVLAVAGSVMQVYTKQDKTWTPVPIWWPVTDSVELTDSGDVLLTDNGVYTRGKNTWLEDSNLAWPMAVPDNVDLALSLSGDGTVLAMGPFVYSLDPANWRPIDAAPFGHTNCDDRADVLEDGCRYELACDQETVESVCDRDATGVWRCTCFGEGQGLAKTVTAATGEPDAICQTAASLCLDGFEPVGSEAVCSRESYSSDGGCSLYTSCTTTTTVEEGVTFQVETGEAGAFCTPTQGGLDCSCGYYSGATGVAVSGAAAPLACELAQDFCEGKLPVGQNISCSESETTESDVGCETTRRCGFSVEVEGQPGVSLTTEMETASSICSDQYGQTVCSCDPAHGNGSTSVAVTASEFGDACRAVDAVCTGDDAVVVGNEVTCSDLYVEGDVTTCNGIADCGPLGQFDGIPVAVTPRLTVACVIASGNQWRCECASGGNATQFGATGSDAEAVCEGAIFSCVENATGVDLYSEDGVVLAFD